MLGYNPAQIVAMVGFGLMIVAAIIVMAHNTRSKGK